MANRNTARETEAVDRKFRQMFNPINPLVDSLVFDIYTGKIIVPEEVQKVVKLINQDWNYAATIFNKKLKGASANFGAIQKKFNNDVSARELRLFNQVVAKVLEEKYGLTADKIDVEFILKLKSDGLTPVQVCDCKVLELETLKVDWFKHKHKWTVVSTGKVGFIILCSECRFQFAKRYLVSDEAEYVASKLPKTKFGLLVNHFKNYKK